LYKKTINQNYLTQRNYLNYCLVTG